MKRQSESCSVSDSVRKREKVVMQWTRTAVVAVSLVRRFQVMSTFCSCCQMHKVFTNRWTSVHTRSVTALGPKHLGGIKDRVDKSMGIVTLIAEALARSRPTESLRFAKRVFFILKGEKIVLASGRECLHKG
jgi:hypothetical protein